MNFQVDMTELKKLKKYLEDKHIKHITKKVFDLSSQEYDQIWVFDKDGKYSWDAICHYGSYGHEQGLIEIMGDIVRNTEDCVEGWLTANDIIARIEGYE